MDKEYFYIFFAIKDVRKKVFMKLSICTILFRATLHFLDDFTKYFVKPFVKFLIMLLCACAHCSTFFVKTIYAFKSISRNFAETFVKSFVHSVVI